MSTRYLYGDSSPAGFENNVIELLRDTVAFSVEVLSAFARIQQLRNQELALRSTMDSEVKKLDELTGVVSRALGASLSGSTGPCASKIIAAAESVVATELAALRAKLGVEVQTLGVQEGEERDLMVRALAALLAQHDLPGAASSTEVSFRDGHYRARTSTIAEDLGMSVVLECEPPAGSVLLQPVRVEKLVGALELLVPDTGGFFRRGVKPRPHRIEKLHVASFHHDDDADTLALRTEADGSGPGLDITITGPAREVSIARLLEGESSTSRFDVDKGDVGKLVMLVDAWAALSQSLTSNRTRLVTALIDGEAFRDSDEPTVLVERLIEAIAPDVQEIARRTPGTNELVIKRVIEGNRREEIFLSKGELKALLEKVPQQRRNLFRPLGLEVVMPSLLPPSMPRSESTERGSRAPKPPATADSMPAITVSQVEVDEVEDVVERK